MRFIFLFDDAFYFNDVLYLWYVLSLICFIFDMFYLFILMMHFISIYSKLYLFKALFIQSFIYSKLYFLTPHSHHFQWFLSISFKL